MKILFIGDVFSSIGREMIDKYLPQLKKKYQIDVVIANVENATHGKGLIKKHYEEFLFHYKGLRLNVSYVSENSTAIAYGNNQVGYLRKLYSSPIEFLNDRVFDGKTLEEIWSELE